MMPDPATFILLVQLMCVGGRGMEADCNLTRQCFLVDGQKAKSVPETFCQIEAPAAPEGSE